MIAIQTSISEMMSSAASFNGRVYNDSIVSSSEDSKFVANSIDHRRLNVKPGDPEIVSVGSVSDDITMIFIVCQTQNPINSMRPVKFTIEIGGELFGTASEFRLVDLDGFDKEISISGFSNTEEDGDARLDIIITRK